jgi:hypothetical protein
VSVANEMRSDTLKSEYPKYLALYWTSGSDVPLIGVSYTGETEAVGDLVTRNLGITVSSVVSLEERLKGS